MNEHIGEHLSGGVLVWLVGEEDSLVVRQIEDKSLES